MKLRWTVPALLILQLSQAALADMAFNCSGVTADGKNEVSVTGGFNSDDEMLWELSSWAQEDCTAPTGGDTSPPAHEFDKRNVQLISDGRVWVLHAHNSNGGRIIIIHPENTIHQTYMRASFGKCFDLEFEHASCSFTKELN